MNEAPIRTRVLALDDDPDDLALLRHHLRGITGMELELVLHGEPREALAAARASAFDVILVDHQLGECTGIDVFHSLQLAGVDVPTILVTDQGDEELAVNALHAGFSDYIPKSALSVRILGRAIANAIEKHRLRTALVAYRKDLERSVAGLRARNDETQSFYHTLSHELKTPLTAAREFVSIVLDGLQGPLTDDQRDSLTRVRGCCDHLTLLMNDILDASRLDTGKLSLQRRTVSVDGLVRQSALVCGAFAAQRGVTLEQELGQSAGEASLDPERMQQVLTNLINNAIKYSPRGGRVVVRAERVPASRDQVERLRLSVQDWGAGIPAEKQERIFERLYQAHADDATVRGGLGLGLHLCRELVQLHEGEIRLESEPGKGSTFSVTIPLQGRLQRSLGGST